MVAETKEPATYRPAYECQTHLRWALLFYHNSFNMSDKKNEFNAIPHLESRKKAFNLAPMEELFSNGIPPYQLACELDKLMLDYVQTIFYLHSRRQPNEDFIHENAPDFIFYLRELRNTLLECTEND